MESSSTIVVKVGTSSILRGDSGHLALSTLASLVETLTTLRQAGHRVVLVSSGAVGVGCQRLNVKTRPSDHAELQALAAVGQPHLMAHYETLFSALKQPIAQVLLNPDALGSRPGYLNAQATLEKLLAMGVVPVVNENDTVAVSELRFGDNDSLSALVAVLVGADHLFLATDVDALYTKNPSAPLAPGEAPAEPIRVVQDIGSVLGCAVGGGSQWGTGGMATKLRAAQLAAAAGIATSILSAQQPALVATLLGGSREVGTTFLPGPKPLRSHKRWIMALPPRGALTLDAGAARAVRNGSTLFAAGVRAATGGFHANEAVRILDESGSEFARGVCNYSCEQAGALAGRRSEEMAAVLGFAGPEELIGRHNLALLAAATPTEGEAA